MLLWRSRLQFYARNQGHHVYPHVRVILCWISKYAETRRGSHLAVYCHGKGPNKKKQSRLTAFRDPQLMGLNPKLD